MSNDTLSILAEIKSLKKPTIKPEDEPVVLLSSLKKKRKEKKKKDKKKNKQETVNDLMNDFLLVQASDEDNDELSIIDISEILEDEYSEDDENDEMDNLIANERDTYKNMKSGKSAYKSEFSKVLALLNSDLGELMKLSKTLEKNYEGMQNSKARGMSKYSNDMLTNILSARSSRLQILKEIANVKKTIADLELKSSKNERSGAETSAEHIATSYLQQIVKGGRANFVNSLSSVSGEDDTEFDTSEALNYLEHDSVERMQYDRLLEERLHNEINQYQDRTDGDKYIKYEKMNVKLCIRRDISSGDWNLIALDKNKQIVEDYPIPPKEDLLPMGFSDDGMYASDKFGRSYSVIQVIGEE